MKTMNILLLGLMDTCLNGKNPMRLMKIGKYGD